MATGSGLSGVSGTAVAATAAGALLIWSGIKGVGVSQALRAVLSGKKPPTAQANPIISGAAGGGADADVAGGALPGDTGASTAEAKKNQALAVPLASLYGWGPGTQNWTDLLSLWNRESGWSNTIENQSSGAYGIAQALGHGPTNQYPAGPANPPVSSATAQIIWGLGYIKSTYGSPSAAWAHEESAGWY